MVSSGSLAAWFIQHAPPSRQLITDHEDAGRVFAHHLMQSLTMSRFNAGTSGASPGRSGRDFFPLGRNRRPPNLDLPLRHVADLPL